jgi:hypothetical protein
MQVRVFDQPETDTTVAMTNQEMGQREISQRREAGPMLRDAAVAANAAWLVVAVLYLMAEGASGGGSLFTFLLAGIGFPLLNLMTVLRSESAEWWED